MEEVQERSVDTGRGGANMTISKQWANRPDDERFVNLNLLNKMVRERARNSEEVVISPTSNLSVLTDENDYNSIVFDVAGTPCVPNHWSFGQLCGLIGAPAKYLRGLPGAIAAMPIEYGIRSRFAEDQTMKVLKTGVGDEEFSLRAFTGESYGRIFDHEVVESVMQIAGDGVSYSKWKVPGVLDWATRKYNPDVDVTKENTTLFASDRDVWIFLVDDKHPIEIGKLANGDSDYLFRGFYVSNSEVGSKTLKIATMYMRAVCANRILWGVEGYNEISIRHSANAPFRFSTEAYPALESFANENENALIQGVKEAKKSLKFADVEAKRDWLAKREFTKGEITEILCSVEKEEGHPAESAWDMVQGITAVARRKTHQDERVLFEERAGKILNLIA